MARHFNPGSSDYLWRSNAVITAYPFTFACWAAATSTGTQNVFSIGNSLDSTQYVRGVFSSSGGLGFAMTPPWASFGGTIPGYAAGTWAHLAYVGASATSRAVFGQGAHLASNSTPVSFPAVNRTAIGALSTIGTTEHFRGLIARAAFWSVALTATEIAALASGVSPLSIRPASLAAYWPLRGLACDRPERDVVRSRDLTVTGTTWASDPPVVGPAVRFDIHDSPWWYAAPAANPPDDPGPPPVLGTSPGLGPERSGVLGPGGSLGWRAVGHHGFHGGSSQ